MQIGETITNTDKQVTYTIIQNLKSGGQAEVAFATANETSTVYFIKRLLNIKYTERTRNLCDAFESAQRKLYRQLDKSLMMGASCPVIVDFFREHTFYYVVTERIVAIPCNTEELFKFLTLQDRLDLFRIIVYSFFPLERNKIVHGDVKPDNILLKRVNNHYVSKLIDLESAFFENNPPERGNIVGTDPYSSPEIIDFNDEEKGELKYKVSTKSDIFSLGVILYEIICGVYPNSFNDDRYAFELVRDQIEIIFPKTVPAILKSLILSMLDIDPQKRPNVLSVLNCLKKVQDVSCLPKLCSSPKVIIERYSFESAYVHLFCLSKNSNIKISIDDGEDFEYNSPIRIDDDDIPIRAYSELLDENGCLIISDPIYTEASVSSERNGRVDRPYIEVIDGTVTISTSTDESLIFYTLDGSLPSRKSSRYDAPLNLPEHTIVKAIAFKRGMLKSDVAARNTSSTIRMS